jgi:hypothetical protein
MIRGMLLCGGFRSFEQINTMPPEDQRNTLIVEMAGRTNQSGPHFQGMDDRTLAGTAATLLFLRAIKARTDEQLKTISDDDQRNLMIIALGDQTGLSGPHLQSMSNIDLVRLGLTADGSGIRGVLLLGRFRTFQELNRMSRDDRRNTLITEMVGRSSQPVSYYQGMNDSSLAGAGAVLVFLRAIRARTDAQLKTITDDDQRNLMIIAMGAQTGLSGPQLQSLTSMELVLEGLGFEPFENRRLIAQRYDAEGRSAGPVGIPMGNVRLTTNGATQPFSGGFITVKDKKVDPVVVFQAEVRYLGFRCNDESDSDGGSSADEPYFVISITGLKSNTTRLFGPYEDVDGGESRFSASGEDVLVTDVQPPFTLSVVAKEHDHGEPAEAAGKVKTAMEDAIRVTQALAVTFGQAQVAAVTVMLNTVFTSVGGFVSDAASAVLGLGDDFVGSNNVRIGDWNDGAEDWRTPARLIEQPSFSQSPYNVKIDVGDGGEGRYSLYFNVNMFKVNRELVPALG